MATFHRHKWFYSVIHCEWQNHEWSMFAILILQLQLFISVPALSCFKTQCSEFRKRLSLKKDTEMLFFLSFSFGYSYSICSYMYAHPPCTRTPTSLAYWSSLCVTVYSGDRWAEFSRDITTHPGSSPVFLPHVCPGDNLPRYAWSIFYYVFSKRHFNHAMTKLNGWWIFLQWDPDWIYPFLFHSFLRPATTLWCNPSFSRTPFMANIHALARSHPVQRVPFAGRLDHTTERALADIFAGVQQIWN